MDGDAKTVECYIRRFAVVGLKVAKVLQEVEKRELATDNRLPVRNTLGKYEM